MFARGGKSWQLLVANHYDANYIVVDIFGDSGYQGFGIDTAHKKLRTIGAPPIGDYYRYYWVSETGSAGN